MPSSASTRAHRILAYHDRSDGGLFATLCEMAFAGRYRRDRLPRHARDAIPRASTSTATSARTSAFAGNLAERVLAVLFNEELGAVLQVRRADREAVLARAARGGTLGRDRTSSATSTAKARCA